MDNSQPATSNPTKPVAVWSTIDGANAKVLLSGNVDVYSLGEVWGQISEAQNTWLGQNAQQSKTLTFDASQVDEIQVYIAPIIIGGQDAITPVGGIGILEMANRQKLASFSSEMIGDNILLSGRLKHYYSE
jgi:phospholipid/cholesterol/gamma-HCH transport system permease protein